MSWSYLKIVDVPYFQPGSKDFIDSGYVREVMRRSHIASSFILANSLCIMWNSQHVDSATVWFNVIDSQSGAVAKHLINSSFQFGPASCPVRPAQSHASVPVCQHCWRWGHSTYTCKSCAGPHSEANYHSLASCCHGNPTANPSVLATMEGAPCPHTTHCVNCNGVHSASDCKCPYWQCCFDWKWLAQCANRDWQEQMAASGAISRRQEEECWDRGAFRRQCIR
ncbi:hypothetical protein AN958_10798 [Leucoagaricus sp. SymC.cos]|nr:hypothetical protein AN958_10798 [Leucoagaricus sp. SymC.cos]